MDATFWIGLLVGAILSLAASIVANLYTDRVQQFISDRRKIRLGNKKASELRTHAFVKKLTLGDPVANLELNRSRDVALYFLGLAAVCLLLFLVLHVDPNIDQTTHVNRLMPIVLQIVVLICVLAFLLTSQSIARTIKKSKDFEQYESDIRSKWGADTI